MTPEQAAELKRLNDEIFKAMSACNIDRFQETRSAFDAYIDRLTQDAQPVQAELTDANKGICPKCSQPWKDHDFGVPAPFCPDPIQERAVIAADWAKRSKQ